MLTPQRWSMIQAMRSGARLRLDADGRVMLGNKQEKRSILNGLLKDGYIQRATNEVDSFELTELGKTAQPKGSSPRHVARPSSIAIYLGVPEVSQRRIAEIDRIAEPFGGRSVMLQMIADGKLVVKPKLE